MPDHSAVQYDEEPASEPAHPKPAATARTVAAGGLLAALALAIGAIAVAFIAGMRLAFSGDDGLNLDGAGLVLLAVAFAATTCLVIIAVSRNWAAPRARTLVLAGSLAVITALSGLPVVAAAVTILAVGAALAHDRLVPGRRAAWGPLPFAALAAAALTAAIAGAAITNTHSHVAEEVSLHARWNPSALLHDAKPPAAAPDAPRGGNDALPVKRKAPPKPKPAPTPGAGGVAPGLEDATAAPAAAEPVAPAAPSPSAEQFVRTYYEDLNAQRWEAAWSVLSPGVRAQLGPFARWKDGYGRTLSSEPQEIVVGAQTSGEVAVTHVLVARDRGCGGPRSFRVTWRLRANSSGWSAVGVHAAAFGSQRC